MSIYKGFPGKRMAIPGESVLSIGSDMILEPEQLIILMTERPFGMPVRDMESLLMHGERATLSLIRFLQEQDLRNPGDEDLLWPVVALGELRDERGVPLLVRILREAHGLELPTAAADGLGKAGMAAFPTLADLLSDGEEIRTRLFAYAALSRLNDQEAWAIIERGLTEDHELDFSAARALAERRLPEDLDLVYRVYLMAEDWKRSALEEILLGMISGNLPWREQYDDWRIRYRRQPRNDLQIPSAWPTMMFLMWEARSELNRPAAGAALSLRHLHELVRFRRHGEKCESCGQTLRSPTGIPLCDEVEEELINYQLGHLQHWKDDLWQDIHEVLDELDHKETEILQWPEKNEDQTSRKRETLEAIDVFRKTLFWLMEGGIEDLEKGEIRLLSALGQISTKKG
jgi:hypothetical protein